MYFKPFLQSLSARLYHENDLSDITWAMCCASSEFQRLFLCFFFSELAEKDVEQLERERPDSSDGDSRVDFYVHVVGEAIPYIIEVKINDRNHHFGQYERAYGIPSERLGYITNYPLTVDGYHVRQWEELYDYLRASLCSSDDTEWVAFVEAYLEYVKGVCGIIKLEKPMKLDGMYSLYELMVLLEKLVKRSEEDFELSLYSNKKGNGNGVQGVWFEVDYKNRPIAPTWAWVGVYYDRPEPCICLCFTKEEGWGKPVFDILDANVEHFVDGVYVTKPYKEEGSYWCELSPEAYQRFQVASLDEQEIILKTFINEAIRYPGKFLA